MTFLFFYVTRRAVLLSCSAVRGLLWTLLPCVACRFAVMPCNGLLWTACFPLNRDRDDMVLVSNVPLV